MHRKLTITVDESVYEGLHLVIGRQRISQFIEDLVRPHVLHPELSEAYLRMAADEAREAEADEWVEGTSGDVADEAR
jgi:predicted CopG family antitoxin